MRRFALVCSASLLLTASPLVAQSGGPLPDARAAMLVQAQEAMAPFAGLAGEWEGTATVYMATGDGIHLASQRRDLCTHA